MQDKNTCEKLSEIKGKIALMLQERAQIEGDNSKFSTPSNYWTDFCSFFDYMLDLSPDSLAKLRLHTHHLTGDYYQTYYFHLDDSQSFLVKWGNLIRGIPEQYVLYEPEGGIGFPCSDGRLVSREFADFKVI